MSLLAVLSLATLAASCITTIRPDPKVPHGASKLVKPEFPSFGIQASSFESYTGNLSHPNTFSRNLIRSIEERTGGPLLIRVGGTNGDYSNFNPDQILPVKPPQEGEGIGQKFVFGPNFYNGFRNWADTRFVYCVPFANHNHTNSLFQASSAIDNIGLDHLEALELGNEPDLYAVQGVRAADYGPADYAAEFQTYAKFLLDALDLSEESPLFEALTLSGGRDVTSWRAKEIFGAGIADSNQIKAVSFHHYEYTNTTTGLQATLMNHTFVKDGINIFLEDFSYLADNYPALDLVMGESGRFTDNESSSDLSQDIFGSALWTADYLLYLMTLNVTRVNMQLGQVFGYVAWHPIQFDANTPPRVLAPYYGHLFVADFMSGSDSLRVAEVPTSYPSRTAAYAAYDHDVLARIAVINYDVWHGEGRRPKREVEVVVPRGVTWVKVQTLTAPGGTGAMRGIYWGGRTWTFESGGVGVRVKGVKEFELFRARNGRVTVMVGASEAVLVHLG